ncbi:class IV adenylate cyclase [Marinitenerispora sediminis]|uniref:Adenylate cyclase n=1 Tax=Marinitenerispora sediminis TaxID=1931232 RepID=A0A368T168_9ACTN|nr:class IV adenylate cyclase [Marinitenerispora sediminis]RCV52551.1 adenylate cyclase [Marinitenerispora sediminis]RCV53781.1 adenylate cyclase [Marinitenerispora sediminis]RCV59617.1 adenylate cyclase [Marinitenerispora sediminis]
MTATTVEYEAKILDVDPDAVAARILRAGGTELGTSLQRRYVYDIEPGDTSRWIRLRDTGSEVTLTVKEIDSDEIGGTRETEIAVSDLETANVLLGKLGYSPKGYQENVRRSFVLAGARVEIDAWPLIPPYVEIEAVSRADVLRVAELLGYGEQHLTGENTVKVYARHGIDLAAIPDLRFPAQDS